MIESLPFYEKTAAKKPKVPKRHSEEIKMLDADEE